MGSKPYPTYVTGPQPNGSWVVGDGQVDYPIPVPKLTSASGYGRRRIALNPNLKDSHRGRSNLRSDPGC